jgi:glyoxylase-like metal-dependent hydrolase (beta-lactamase superfamily II)
MPAVEASSAWRTSIGDVEIMYVKDSDGDFDGTWLYADHSAEEIAAVPGLADENGRVRITVGGWLLRSPDWTVLVDVGIGPVPGAPYRPSRLPEALRDVGVEPGEIDHVVITHLHFDHIGWMSHEGRATFENAQVHLDERWMPQLSPSTYRPTEFDLEYMAPELRPPSLFAPVLDRVAPWGSDGWSIPGLRAVDLPGHMAGHAGVQVTSGGATGWLIGDAAHHPVEMVRAGWGGLGDDDPDQAEATRQELLHRFANEQVPFCAAHFGWGRMDPGRERFVPLES